MRRLLAVILIASMHLWVGCASDDDGKPSGRPKPPSATETNVAPAPCKSDEDCGDAGVCNPPFGPDGLRFCNVDEMEVSTSGPSSAAPAPCKDDGDCPKGVACVHWSGASGPGACDVVEHTAP